ncbi:hypothetical protein LLG39_16450, partial [bacterium]|nr:hypothetical protein [bacterium]
MKLGSRLWAIVIMVMFIMMLCLPVMAVNIVPTGVSAGVGGLSTNGGELGIKTTAGAYLFRVVKGTGVTTASAPFQGTSTIYGAVDPVVYNVRVRSTAAEIGAGKTLVAVPTGLSFRLIDCKAIAYGGAVATTTTVDILDGST